MVRVVGDPTVDVESDEPRPSPPRSVRSVDGVLVAIVVVAGLLRFGGLGSQSLWYDEWLTTEATSGSLRDLLRHVANREGMPPTFFLLEWGWTRIFGDGEASLRFLPALAGVATVPVVYAAVSELNLRRIVARVAALLVAVHPMLVWYSQEARPYSILALFGALSLWTFARVWHRPGRTELLAWAVVCAGAIAFHYFAAFLVVAEAAALLLARRRPWRELVLAGVPSAVVLALLAPVLARQDSRSGTREWITDFPLADRLREGLRAALVGPSAPDRRLWLVAAAAVLVAAALLVLRAGREERAAAALVAALGGAAVVLPIVVAPMGLDAVVSRYLIAALVPLVVAVAVGLAAPRSFGIGLATVAVLVVVSVGTVVAMAVDPDLQRPDWDEVAAALGESTDGEVLVVDRHGLMASPLRHYAEDAEPVVGDETVRVASVVVVAAQPTPERKSCNFLVGRACALVFLGAPLPPEIAGELELTDRLNLDQFRIDRYRTADGPLEVSRADLVAPETRDDALVLVDP